RIRSLDIRPGIREVLAGGESLLTAATVAAGSAKQLAQEAQHPLSPGTGAAPTPSHAFPARRVADLTVVLVEPSRTQASIVRKYLQQLGINKVHSTGSAREALELVRANRADALISALHLADTTGVQLAQTLRADPGTSGIGFILTSSEADSADLGSILGTPRT